MSEYKWCICDMDGTLLNSENRISEENKQALSQLKQKGVEVMIASGRVDLMLKQFIKQLDLKGYVISCNGGLIRNIDTNEIIYANTMNNHMVKNIVTNCMEENIDFLIYTAEYILANPANRRAQHYEEWNKNQEEHLQFAVKYIDHSNMDVLDELNIIKVLLICENYCEVQNLQKQYSQYDNLTVVSSASNLLDIMARDTSKGRALKFLADKRHVKLEHVIAFGDNYNDMDMLQCVGMPVAMENSVEELKSKAKFITKSNNHSGIAYALSQIFDCVGTVDKEIFI
jgi:HAD-superfamily hydrolase, subfamily IIB